MLLRDKIVNKVRSYFQAEVTPETADATDPSPGLYRHEKTGSMYSVLLVARCSTNGPRENLERSVVYYSLDREEWKYRKVSEFMSPGRFSYQGEDVESLEPEHKVLIAQDPRLFTADELIAYLYNIEECLPKDSEDVDGSNPGLLAARVRAVYREIGVIRRMVVARMNWPLSEEQVEACRLIAETHEAQRKSREFRLMLINNQERLECMRRILNNGSELPNSSPLMFFIDSIQHDIKAELGDD